MSGPISEQEIVASARDFDRIVLVTALVIALAASDSDGSRRVRQERSVWVATFVIVFVAERTRDTLRTLFI